MRSHEYLKLATPGSAYTADTDLGGATFTVPAPLQVRVTGCFDAAGKLYVHITEGSGQDMYAKEGADLVADAMYEYFFMAVPGRTYSIRYSASCNVIDFYATGQQT